MDTITTADRLDIRDAEGKITRVDLAGERAVIGRAEDADIQIDHPAVSRRHAELFRDPFGRWWVRDLKSHNGTKVNGVAVPESVVAYDDSVEIGPFVLRLRPAGCLSTGACTGSTSTASVGEAAFASITSLGEVVAPRLGAAHLDVLGEFARRLQGTPDPLSRLRVLCELTVSREFHGRMAAVIRVEKGRAANAPVLCGPVCPPGVECRTPYISQSLLRAVFERQQPVMGSNIARGGSSLEMTVGADVRDCTAIACPICSDDRGTDALYVLLPPEFGTGEWLSLVSLVVEEYQRAELAWLARRQSEDHARIEKDLGRAREIQSRLIPRDIRIAGLDIALGFEPCRWVGGDYVDAIATADGRAFLTVADACGKGMQAALVASGVHGRVHSALESGMGMHDMMLSLNRYLHEFLPGDSFVTMCAILLDPADGEIQIVNAGHPAPIVVDASGGAVRRLESGLNPPLGVTQQIELGRERLAPSEMLGMFTDGLLEVGEMRDVEDGLTRMADWLRAARVEISLSAVASRLSGLLADEDAGGLAADDRTFLLARRLG